MVAGSGKDIFKQSKSGKMSNPTTLKGLYLAHKSTLGEEEANRIFNETYNIKVEFYEGRPSKFSKIESSKEA